MRPMGLNLGAVAAIVSFAAGLMPAIHPPSPLWAAELMRVKKETNRGEPERHSERPL